jgi:hypothetical protein
MSAANSTEQTGCSVSETDVTTAGRRGSDGDGEKRRTVRPLVEDEPREEADEHDLRVAEHGREPGADLVDRVVPEDEVGGEEQAREPRERARPQRAAAPAAPLPEGDRPQRRKRPQAAEERAGRRRDVREAKEDQIPENAIATAPARTVASGRRARDPGDT